MSVLQEIYGVLTVHTVGVLGSVFFPSLGTGNDFSKTADGSLGHTHNLLTRSKVKATYETIFYWGERYYTNSALDTHALAIPS